METATSASLHKKTKHVNEASGQLAPIHPGPWPIPQILLIMVSAYNGHSSSGRNLSLEACKTSI